MTLHLLSLGMALALGMGLGCLHFGGLWLTLRRLGTARQPYLLLWASTLVRLGVSVAGLYGVIRYGSGVHLLVCLGGFLGTRYYLVRHWWPVSA